VNFRLRPSLLPAKRRIKEEVCFIDIVAFGTVAERSKTFLQKGAQVLVDGRLSQKRWESAEGKPRSKYEVIATTVQFLNQSNSSAHEPASDDDRYRVEKY